MSGLQKTPQLYLSMPHSCGYLPNRMASTLFIDPHHPIDNQLFSILMHQGFRRSGDLIYRPHCTSCTACVPVRVSTEKFQPTRGQKRTWQKNQDLRVQDCDSVFNAEQFELYLRYQRKRHPGGGMDNLDSDMYMDFLISRHTHTRFFEFRESVPLSNTPQSKPRAELGKLLCVAVVDPLPDGLSAVYTFYDPAASVRGLGVYAILWEIAHAKQLGLPWVYLGYWIDENPKMAYKANYRPLEAYHDGRWTKVHP